MGERRVITIIGVILIISGVVAGYNYYSNNRIENEISGLIRLISATSNITYGEIHYYASKDSAMITDIQVDLQERGVITIKRLTLDGVYEKDVHSVVAEDFVYVTNNGHGGVLNVEKISIVDFSLVSFITFLTGVQNSADYVLLPSWLSSPFNMESCEMKNLTYVQNDGLIVTVEHSGWQGPLVKGKVPEHIVAQITNARVIPGDRLDKFSKNKEYLISNLVYIRQYDSKIYTYEEKFENAVFEDMFRVDFEYKLSDFNISNLLTAENGAVMKKMIIDNASLNSAKFVFTDRGLTNSATDYLTTLIKMNGKQFVTMWLKSELPRNIPNMQNKQLISESLTVFVNTPGVLALSVAPKKPVPLKGLESGDNKYFNDLNIRLFVNGLEPFDIKRR